MPEAREAALVPEARSVQLARGDYEASKDLRALEASVASVDPQVQPAPEAQPAQ